jgi:predicted RNA binding protein YcfA (HicA-like mRNA interferase family)
MGNLRNISGKQAVKAFRKAGWQSAGQVGCHIIMIKHGTRVNLSIPQHKELSVDTHRILVRCSGMTVDEFLVLLK